MSALREKDEALMLSVYVQPGAKADMCTGLFDGRVKISLRASAVKNQANQSLIRFIAKRLGLPRREVCLVSGEKGRHKTVCVPIVAKESVKQWLSELDAG